MKSKNWTRDEHIVAFNLYCKIPFTKINSTYPPVLNLAKVIGRSNGSVAMKLANFARLDPVLKARNVSGLTQGAKGEEEVWNEFNDNWEELAWQSEQILASYKGQSVEDTLEVNLEDLPLSGKEREAIVKIRVNQAFFRKTILASYNYSCCITGISIPELLVASHIIPWFQDKPNRMNPANGMCLNALHDSAFDKGLLTITPDYKIKLSNALINNITKEFSRFFLPYQNQSIRLPQKFFPDKEFLDWHNKNVFI
jgi:putative restriction endonuclease